jgi:hypothetical protein
MVELSVPDLSLPNRYRYYPLTLVLQANVIGKSSGCSPGVPNSVPPRHGGHTSQALTPKAFAGDKGISQQELAVRLGFPGVFQFRELDEAIDKRNLSN